MSDTITIDRSEWERLLRVKNAAEGWAEAAEILASLPFRGLLFGGSTTIDEEATREYSRTLRQLYQAAKGFEIADQEPVTTSLAAMIKSLPDIPDHVRAVLLKGLQEETP